MRPELMWLLSTRISRAQYSMGFLLTVVSLLYHSTPNLRDWWSISAHTLFPLYKSRQRLLRGERPTSQTAHTIESSTLPCPTRSLASSYSLPTSFLNVELTAVSNLLYISKLSTSPGGTN